MSPNGPRPGRIARATSHNMQMQLGRDIAQGPEVQLVHRQGQDPAQGSHGLARQYCFLHQTSAVRWAKVFNFAKSGAPGDQDEPGIAGVILQTDMAKCQVADGMACGQERRIGSEEAHPAQPREGTAAQ